MLTARAADYLETIYLLSLSNDTVGVSRVAAERKVTIPTARAAVGRLRDLGYVRQERYGKIVLTEKGRHHAATTYRTHKALFRFLREVLKVDAAAADREACRLEHGLGRDTLGRLVLFLDALPVSAPPDAGSAETPANQTPRRGGRR